MPENPGRLPPTVATQSQPAPLWKSVAKAIGAIVGFAVAVLTLFATLVQLDVISNPFASSIDKLTKAGQQLSDAGSARVNEYRVISFGSHETSQTAQGDFDFRSGTGTLRFTNGLRQIFLSPYAYETAPGFKGDWCKYDLSVLGPGLLWGVLSGFQDDPGAILGNLDSAGTSHDLGDQVLFGVPVTHYSGEINLQKVLAMTKDPQRRRLIMLVAKVNNNKIPLEVWVGKTDDRVDQLAADFSFAGSDVGLKTTDKVHVHVVFGFSHYGVNVAVSPPPASKTVDGGTAPCPAKP